MLRKVLISEGDVEGGKYHLFLLSYFVTRGYITRFIIDLAHHISTLVKVH